MTTYRVGPEGATVFAEDGQVACHLRPGLIVVPGSSDEPGSLAAQHQALAAKRISRYADKAIHPAEDKTL